MTLLCALCMYVRKDVQEEAVTVMRGVAVCHDHMGYLQGAEFGQVLRFAREQEERTRDDS